MEYAKQLETAKQLAKEAGEIMRRYFQSSDLGLETKEDNTPVTIADTTINSLVIDRIKAEYPECGVIGEEESYESDRENVWVVDPIDGTMPFSLGVPVSTFCLAYVEAGHVKASVVYDPFRDNLYSAALDGGAYCNDQKIQVSNHKTIKHCYMSLGGTPHRSTHQILEDMDARVFDFYSYAYSAVLVASGKFVCAGMGYGSPWDAASASLIVQEAGGIVTDLKGEERYYNEWGDGILMTNGYVHKDLVKAIDYENTRD